METRRPRSVSLAVGVIGIELVIWAIRQLSSLPIDSKSFGSIITLGAFASGIAIVVILLVFIARRRNWARVAFVILAALSLPGAVVGIALPGHGTTRLLEALGLAMTVLAAVLLLLPESNCWFTRGRSAETGDVPADTEPVD